MTVQYRGFQGLFWAYRECESVAAAVRLRDQLAACGFDARLVY